VSPAPYRDGYQSDAEAVAANAAQTAALARICLIIGALPVFVMPRAIVPTTP
jgi:hypothetical protein